MRLDDALEAIVALYSLMVDFNVTHGLGAVQLQLIQRNLMQIVRRLTAVARLL